MNKTRFVDCWMAGILIGSCLVSTFRHFAQNIVLVLTGLILGIGVYLICRLTETLRSRVRQKKGDRI